MRIRLLPLWRVRQPPKPPEADRRTQTNPAPRFPRPLPGFSRGTSALHSQRCGIRRFRRRDRCRRGKAASRSASNRRPAKLRSSFRGSTQVRYAERPPASICSARSTRVPAPHREHRRHPAGASCFSRYARMSSRKNPRTTTCHTPSALARAIASLMACS